MANSTREDVKTQELNSIFKSLGERGKDGKIIKEHNEYVGSYFFRELSELLSKRHENSIMFRPYGSAAEDLKCVEFEDIGDVDVMIFPNSDTLMIRDELLEYLPMNPLHVRIKGVNHPVLQSCLVEGTDYVATAALKNFHPAIYGSYLPHLADFVIRALQVASREGINNYIWEWKNSSKSPAVTLNFAQSNGSICEQLEKQKDSKNLANLDVSEWEWMAHDLCTARGIDYTKEHAQVITDLFQYVHEVQLSLNKQGLSGDSRMFPDVVHELLFSDRAETLKARYRDIDRRTQNERRRIQTSSVAAVGNRDNDQHCFTPENCDKSERKTKRNEENSFLPPYWSDESRVKPPNTASDSQLTSAEVLEVTSSQSPKKDSLEKYQQLPEKAMSMYKQRTCKGEDDRTGEKTNAFADHDNDLNGSKTEPPASGQKGELGCKEPICITRDDKKEDEDKNVEERIHDRCFKHLFETETDSKTDAPSKGTEFEDTEEAQLHDVAGGFDFVPALRSRGWPMVAMDWIKRERKWPSPDLIGKVIQEGFHLVVKPPKDGGNPDCDFRISFSHAEYLLSQEINDIQRELYRCLKKYHRAYLSTEPGGLVTFHLKNLLLQTIEQTGAEMWTESNRTDCMMKLFGNLLEALKKKDLPHFFVRSYNLFGVDYIESPEILESLRRKVEQIVESPMQFAKELLLHQEQATRVKKKKCVPITEPIPSAKAAPGQGHREKQKTPSKQKKEATYQGSTNSGKLRFHDLKDIFLATSKELIELAFNHTESDRIQTLDSLERSLVEDLREIKRKHNIPVQVFPMMFDGECWDMAYYKVWISTEPNMRSRMLGGIQGVIEMWKYILQQDDFGTGNEEAILRRMLDPYSENPFDLSHVLPAGAGTQYLNRLVNSVKPRPAQQQVMDEIPLD